MNEQITAISNLKNAEKLAGPGEKCWVNWKYEVVDGRETKVPYIPGGRKASSTDPLTWSTFAGVTGALDHFDGIGIVFTGKLLGIDLDHVIADGKVSEKINEIVEKAGTYTEVSPSGTGLHLFLTLTEPLPLLANKSPRGQGSDYECYTAGRYFTVTGKEWEKSYPIRTVTPDEASDILHLLGYPWKKQAPAASKAIVLVEGEMVPKDEDILKKMFSAVNGRAIKRLYDGNISQYGGDDSTADAALCAHLAFWTGRNAPQMERIWLESPLGQREKTVRREDYRQRTINFAISNCNEIYTGEISEQNIMEEEAMEECQLLLDKIPADVSKELIIPALRPLFKILATKLNRFGAEIYIRNNIKNHFKIVTNDLSSIIKYFKEMRVKVWAEIEAEQKAAYLELEGSFSEEEKRTAENVLKSPALLYDALQMVKKLGVVGEEENILLHYTILTSRKLKHPLSATVKGDSSAGKSYALLTTIKLFPKSAYIDLTDATPQSFYYCPEDHFKHKIIVIFEKHGGEKADYAIRTLQSEGKVKIQVTVKNPDTGQFEAQTIEKEGPTGFVTTTTASMIHAENDTRNISMFPDQSSEQTSLVYESVGAPYLGIRPIGDDELKPWHHAQLILEQLPVYIPFVRSFEKYFPKHILRTRRDYGHFLAIIETSAFLHQIQREKVELNGIMYIRATLADAYIAKIIVEKSLSKSIYELPEKTIEVIKAAHNLIEDIRKEDFEESGAETFTKSDLADKLGWDRDTAEKWMEPATKKGYFTIVDEHRGSKPATYKLEPKEIPGGTFLPTIEQLIADNPDEKTDGVYNPLTGESIVLESKQEMLSTDAPMSLEVV